MGKFSQKAIRSELYLAFTFLYLRIYDIFGDLLDYLLKTFPSPDNKLSLTVVEILEVLADNDYYENVVIEEDKKRKFMGFLSQQLKSRVIMTLDQSCLNLAQGNDDQRYKYQVKALEKILRVNIYYIFWKGTEMLRQLDCAEGQRWDSVRVPEAEHH